MGSAGVKANTGEGQKITRIARKNKNSRVRDGVDGGRKADLATTSVK